MLIVCPSCATSYDVQPGSLEPNGRQVRCVRCRTVWHAEPNPADRLMAAAEALAPVAEPPAADVPVRPKTDEDGAAAEAANGTENEAAEPDRDPYRDPAEAMPPETAAEELDPQSAWTVDTGNPPSEPAEVEAPSLAPVHFDPGIPDREADAAGQSAGPAQNDIETFAARHAPGRARRMLRQWSLSRLQVAILVLLVVDSVVVGWRKDIVHVLPQTASLYAAMGIPVNVRGLSFDQVVTSMEVHEGVPILVVEGNIVNDTGANIEVPRLKLELRNAAQQDVYSWSVGPPRARLPAYQAAAFRVRLASPPTEGRDLLVRFLTRRDIVADTR